MVNPALLLFKLTEQNHQMYFVFDPYLKKFTYVNPAFESFFKVTADQASIDTIFAMVHPDDQAYLTQTYAALQPDILKKDIEFRITVQDKEHFIRLTCLFQDRDNMITGLIENITDYKAHNDKLNEFSDKKNAVLNILSHDLAGPLGSIQNISAILFRKKTLQEDPEIKKWISLIEEISKKSVHMIQEFVKQEFIESSGVELVKRRTDLIKVFEQMILEYQQSETEMKITFHFNTNSPHIFAEIDENKFFQAISNLFSNAIKFTPDGGTITLSLEEKEKTILLTVADTGIGIPQKFHKHLFDKFNPARRTGLKGEPSVGLGMSIIKTIVKWHNGAIWFESEENKGTSFYIEIAKCS